MAEYRLSERARADIEEIYRFTALQFGDYQAEAYFSRLERSFGLLADFPRIGQAVDELRAGYLRFRFQSHFIFLNRGCGRRRHSRHHPSARNIRPQLFS